MVCFFVGVKNNVQYASANNSETDCGWLNFTLFLSFSTRRLDLSHFRWSNSPLNYVLLTFTTPAQVYKRLKHWMAVSTETVFEIIYPQHLVFNGPMNKVLISLLLRIINWRVALRKFILLWMCFKFEPH